MSEQIYEFKNVADILVLDEKQFERFLADFNEDTIFIKTP